jgi:hypothetical protein
MIQVKLKNKLRANFWFQSKSLTHRSKLQQDFREAWLRKWICESFSVLLYAIHENIFWGFLFLRAKQRQRYRKYWHGPASHEEIFIRCIFLANAPVKDSNAHRARQECSKHSILQPSETVGVMWPENGSFKFWVHGRNFSFSRWEIQQQRPTS